MKKKSLFVIGTALALIIALPQGVFAAGCNTDTAQNASGNLLNYLNNGSSPCQINDLATILTGNKSTDVVDFLTKLQGSDCSNDLSALLKQWEQSQGNNNSNGNNSSNNGSNSGNAGNNGSNSGNENTENNGNPGSTTGTYAYAKEILDLVNAERAKAGVKALILDEELCYSATLKSTDMAKSNYFSHNSPTYGTPFQMMKSLGINYSYAGENIAMGQKSPEAVMTAWMNSQGHKDNILSSNFTHLGVGYATNTSGTPYWTQQFIKP